MSNNQLNCDPKTKEDWSYLLEYIYQYWIKCGHHVTVYPPCYVKGALRCNVISRGRIGKLA